MKYIFTAIFLLQVLVLSAQPGGFPRPYTLKLELVFKDENGRVLQLDDAIPRYNDSLNLFSLMWPLKNSKLFVDRYCFYYGEDYVKHKFDSIPRRKKGYLLGYFEIKNDSILSLKNYEGTYSMSKKDMLRIDIIDENYKVRTSIVSDWQTPRDIGLMEIPYEEGCFEILEIKDKKHQLFKVDCNFHTPM